ncbi:ABC transporter ATP-binding protein [candidate division KSB1 bacterium]|nr:ABC transporter ATP-binding protein [candidate division KSB1 bacterium]
MTTQGKHLLTVHDITLAYEDQAVISDLSMDVDAGSFIGLIGPNGAGKTTLMLALSGQFHPARGRIEFENSDIYKANDRYKGRIGFVHEAPFAYPYFTAEEFLHLIARVKGVPVDHIPAQVRTALEAVCLMDERHKLTSDLSMGMKKKLAIAAATLGRPNILFLDEALNGVDVESAFHIKEMLKDFVARGGTVILSTHILEVIEKICSRYVLLKAGRIIADIQADAFAAGDEFKHGDLEQYVVSLLR